MTEHNKQRDPLHRIERLAVLASAEKPPRTDVAAAVLRRIRRKDKVINEKQLAWLAAGALAAAIFVMVFSVPAFMALTDPLNTLFESTPLASL